MTESKPDQPINPVPEKSTTEGSATAQEKKPYSPEKKHTPVFKAKETLALGLTIAGTLILLLLTHFLPKSSVTKPATSSKQTTTKTADQGSGTTNGLPLTEINRGQNSPSSGDEFASEETINRTWQRENTQQQRVEQRQPNEKTVGDVKPFQNQTAGSSTQNTAEQSVNAESPANLKSEHDELGQPSLVFVRSEAQTNLGQPSSDHSTKEPGEIGTMLAPGTRLRAHLTSAVNTAVDTPVIAVVDYDYVIGGDTVVPAGSKVFGRLTAADRSGYLGVRFDSMLLPGGESLTIQATATDLRLRPLRGKTQGKNNVTRVLVSAFTGIGEVAATVVGAGNLNQSVSQSDLIKARVTDNLGRASDEEVTRLTATEHVIVSLPANTAIYVVLQKTAAPPSGEKDARPSPTPATKSQSQEQLQQLLQLQKELNENAATEQSN